MSWAYGRVYVLSYAVKLCKYAVMQAPLRPLLGAVIAPRRNEAIEALRTIGVLLLITYHVALISPLTVTSGVAIALQRIAASGWIGTDLLLAIGGFLCIDSVSRAKAYLPWLLRRVWRIAPVYWAWLVVYLHLLPRALERLGYLPETYATYQLLAQARAHEAVLWTMTTNLAFAGGTDIGASLEPLLTIAIGVQLGLVTSLVQRLRQGKLLPGFLFALILGAVVLRFAWAAQIQALPWRIYSFPLTRCDAFAGGALAAWALRSSTWSERVRQVAPSLLKITLGLFAIVFVVTAGLRVTKPLTQLLSYPVIGLMASVLVLTAALRPIADARSVFSITRRWLGRAGILSFGIYLVKLPLLYATRGLIQTFGLEPSLVVLLTVGLVVVPLGGFLWYIAVERTLLGKALSGRPRYEILSEPDGFVQGSVGTASEH